MSVSVDIPITNLLAERTAFQLQLPKWQGIAKEIAEAYSCPISEIEQLLSTEAHQLEQGAHIKEFIPTLAIKRAKELLRLNRRSA